MKGWGNFDMRDRIKGEVKIFPNKLCEDSGRSQIECEIK